MLWEPRVHRNLWSCLITLSFHLTFGYYSYVLFEMAICLLWYRSWWIIRNQVVSTLFPNPGGFRVCDAKGALWRLMGSIGLGLLWGGLHSGILMFFYCFIRGILITKHATESHSGKQATCTKTSESALRWNPQTYTQQTPSDPLSNLHQQRWVTHLPVQLSSLSLILMSSTAFDRGPVLLWFLLVSTFRRISTCQLSHIWVKCFGLY